MLASQLCMFDDKIDSKSKWVEKLSMVQLSGLSSLFCEDLDLSVIFCRNLMTMHAQWMCHALPQGIRTIKTFTKYKNCYFWYIYHTQKKTHTHTRSSVECWEHCDKIKTLKSKVPNIKYPYFAKIFKIFVVKLKLFRKSREVCCFWVWITLHWC